MPDLVFDDRFFQDAGEDATTNAEDCTNGQDDDGNLLTDCDDPACMDHSCVSAAPEGWTGHVVLFVGEGTAPPTCAEPFPTLTFSGWTELAPEDAQCVCECGSPSGYTCDGSFILDKGPSCLPGLTIQLGVTPGSCHDADVSPYSASHATAANVEKDGSCAVTNQSVVVPKPVWSKQVRACSGTLGKCADGACAPKSPSGFNDGVCIHRKGVQPCPVGPYAKGVVMYPVEGVVDTRACSTCTCTIDLDCGKPFEVWSEAGCTGNLLGSVPPGGTCTALSTPDPTVSVKAPTPSAACVPSGGQATGSLVEDPTDAVTFCCTE